MRWMHMCFPRMPIQFYQKSPGVRGGLCWPASGCLTGTPAGREAFLTGSWVCVTTWCLPRSPSTRRSGPATPSTSGPSHTTGSWVRGSNEKMWQARMKTAFFLFDLAERIQGEEKARLFELSYTETV
eukprot:XP_014066291.1 PREDICTED: transmembrane protein 260-like [Salmo salar]